jgi:hypothetical protein
MYLKDVLIRNSGALERFDLKATFNSDGSPQPIVLVGTNGSGKTSLLSIIADGLVEIAARAYQDVAPTQGVGHQFFRVLGGRSVRVGSSYELAALRFEHGAEELYYQSKAGTIDPQFLNQELQGFPAFANWGPGENNKSAIGNV